MTYKKGDKAIVDNTNRQGETLGSVGPYVKVTWNDAASTFKQYRINAENPSEHLTICETVGELVAMDDKALVIIMHGSQSDGCDIMAVPRDWTQKIEILESQGECILENLESLPELEDVTTSTNSNKK
jgi:ribosomal protein L14